MADSTEQIHDLSNRQEKYTSQIILNNVLIENHSNWLAQADDVLEQINFFPRNDKEFKSYFGIDDVVLKKSDYNNYNNALYISGIINCSNSGNETLGNLRFKLEQRGYQGGNVIYDFQKQITQYTPIPNMLKEIEQLWAEHMPLLETDSK
ncbi:MAG: hypothetical protein ACP5N2_07495 [Candidatus Nanoarchaeia archaeon]